MIRAIDHCNPELLEARIGSGKYRRDPILGLEKRCAACREYFPADSEFFFAGSDGDHLHCFCKDCHTQSRHRAAERRSAPLAT